MRRKQLAKRVAIAVLSAATVMTSVPATAVFAGTNDTVVDYKENTATDVQKGIQAAVKATNFTALSAKAQYEDTDDYDNAIVTYIINPINSTLQTNGSDYRLATAGVSYTIQGPTFNSAYTGLTDAINKGAIRVTAEVDDASNPAVSEGNISFDIAVSNFADNQLLDVATLLLQNLAGDSDLTHVTVTNKSGVGATGEIASALLDSLTGKNSETVTVSKVNSGSVTTPATKDADGVFTGSVDLKVTYTPASTTATDAKTATKTVTFTAAIPRLKDQSDDDDYQNKVAQIVKDAGLDNDDFDANGDLKSEGEGSTVGVEKIKTALKKADLDWNNEMYNTLKIEARNYKKATHAKDGSVNIIIDAGRGSEDKVTEYSIIGATVKHSESDIRKEVYNALDDALKDLKADPSKIQPSNAGKAATKEEAAAAIKSAIESELEDKLGGDNTILSEIDKIDVEIADTGYTASTEKTFGSVTYKVKVTSKVPSADPNVLTTWYPANDAATVSQATDVNAKEYTVTNLPKINAVEATSFDLDDQYYIASPANRNSSSLKIDPELTPSDANVYKIRWTVSNPDKFAVWEDIDKNGSYKGQANEFKTTTTTTNTGVTVIARIGQVDEGDSTTLTAELINYDNEVVKTVKTKVSVLNGFVDNQNPNAYYYDYVNDLSTPKTVNVNGKDTKVAVINGKTKDLFKPNDDVTRGEFITMLYRQAQWNAKEKNKKFTDSAATTKFSDVDSKAFYAKAVDWAVANGIANGTSDTTFSPNKKISRAEAVTFLNRMVGADASYTGRLQFTDVSAKDYCANAVAWASGTGVTSGKSATIFAPNDTATRAEAAAFICRTFKGSNLR